MNSAPNSAHNSNNNSEASSEYSNEVIKEGMISYRKGTFGRWKKSIFRLTGNGIITETSDNRVILLLYYRFDYLIICFPSSISILIIFYF